MQSTNFIYCHDVFPTIGQSEWTLNTTQLYKHLEPPNAKWTPHTITTGAKDAVREHLTKEWERLKISKSKVNTLLKHIHQIAIKYLTNLVLNKKI